MTKQMNISITVRTDDVGTIISCLHGMYSEMHVTPVDTGGDKTVTNKNPPGAGANITRSQALKRIKNSNMCTILLNSFRDSQNKHLTTEQIREVFRRNNLRSTSATAVNSVLVAAGLVSQVERGLWQLNEGASNV